MTFILQKNKLKPRKIKWLSQVHKADPDTGSSSHVWIWELDHKESWAPKNWCFWTVMLDKTVPWTARRSNQSILKEISPEYSLEGLMLKPKLMLATWCKELTHLKRLWCWERLKTGGEGAMEDEKVGWHHQFDGHEFEQASGVGDGQRGKPGVL